MCVCVSLCVYVCVCVCVHVYVCIYVCVCVCVLTTVYICMCTRVRTCVHMCVWALITKNGLIPFQFDSRSQKYTRRANLLIRRVDELLKEAVAAICTNPAAVSTTATDNNKNSITSSSSSPNDFDVFHLFSGAVALRIAHHQKSSDQEKAAGRQMTIADIIEKYSFSSTSSSSRSSSNEHHDSRSNIDTLTQSQNRTTDRHGDVDHTQMQPPAVPEVVKELQNLLTDHLSLLERLNECYTKITAADCCNKGPITFESPASETFFM